MAQTAVTGTPTTVLPGITTLLTTVAVACLRWLVSSLLTGSTATSPTTTMEQGQGPADPFAGIRLWLLQLLSHLAVVLFTFAVWWCARREKEEEKVEKKYPKGKITKKRKYRRNRSLGTTSSQEATQEEEEDEEQEEEEKESKPEEGKEEEKPSSSKERAGKFEQPGESILGFV